MCIINLIPISNFLISESLSVPVYCDTPIVTYFGAKFTYIISYVTKLYKTILDACICSVYLKAEQYFSVLIEIWRVFKKKKKVKLVVRCKHLHVKYKYGYIL